MAYGAETAGAGALAHTIYIRPSRDLFDRSWKWPESWHRAFERATAELALAAATCVLEGLPVTMSLIALQLTDDCIEFQVECKGASVYIAVLAFTGPETGPDAPGPDGGCQQPRPADGLVLGLRGCGRTFQLVVFQGYMPAIPGPARNVLSLTVFERAIRNRIDSCYAIHSTTAYWNAVGSNSVYPNDLLQYLLTTPSKGVQAILIGLGDAMSDGRAAASGSVANARPAPLPTLRSDADWPVDIRQLFQCIAAQDECAQPTPCRYPTSSAARDARCLDVPQASVWGMQRPLSDLLPGQYLH